MEWIKRHKLWSLIILYFGVGVGAMLIYDPLAIGELIGLFFWGYLFVCFMALKIAERKQGKEDEKA